MVIGCLGVERFFSYLAISECFSISKRFRSLKFRSDSGPWRSNHVCVYYCEEWPRHESQAVNFFSEPKVTSNRCQKMSSELAGGDVTEQWKEGSMWKGTLKLDAVV